MCAERARQILARVPTLRHAMKVTKQCIGVVPFSLLDARARERVTLLHLRTFEHSEGLIPVIPTHVATER